MRDPDPEDVIAIKAKYREERAKRIREEGVGQYVPMRGKFERMLEDPYADPNFTRAPIVEETELVVVGGGFGGLLAAARLREAGVRDMRIIDKAGDFGGTWYWNRYPGAACDIEGYIYMPMLEETGEIPVEKYSKAPEIFKHAKEIARIYDLYGGALFQTVLTEMRWDEGRGRWIVKTDRGDEIAARFAVISTGNLEAPKLPGIPGLERFAGHAFHTSRWDYGYTGGDVYGKLDRLADKKVGIIGTGATGVQCIPHLARSARHLYVFQRTPSTIGVRGNRPTDYDWAKTLQPGWQKRRMENFNNLVSISEIEEEEDLVADGWTDVIRRVLLYQRELRKQGVPPKEAHALAEIADIKQMEEIRARVEAVVRDKATAEALKPYYSYFCKRPCFHDEFLDAFNQPNVTLVDTDGRGVDEITERGIRVGEAHYDLDCIIYATGFDFGADAKIKRAPQVHGRDGVSLADKFEDGAQTFHGLYSHDFPNLFLFNRAQAGVTTNIPHMLREQAAHIAYVYAEAMKRGATRIEASAEAEASWTEHASSQAILRRKFFEECTPGYLNNEGQLKANAARNAPYGAGPAAYIRIMSDWREKGDLAGLELS
jgi:cyclohexanone monooxygenase